MVYRGSFSMARATRNTVSKNWVKKKKKEFCGQPSGPNIRIIEIIVKNNCRK